MPRSEIILTIFVASPSDVSEERDRLDNIVNGLNSALARQTGIRLELLRWERDVSPAVGQDSQAVINDQIPQDYDVFVGILWNRLGSPTRRADSGTAEEYEMAKARHDDNPDGLRLMLYFKNSPPETMKGFDPDQYKKVTEFRSRVEEEGVLFGEFVDVDEFANNIRIDLTKLILAEASVHGRTVEISEVECRSETSGNDGIGLINEDDDEGYLDLSEEFEEEMDSLSSTLNRMGDAITDVGGNIEMRTEEIKALNSSVDGKILSLNERRKYRADALRIIKRSSKDMVVFTKRMKLDIPLFRRHLHKSINVFTKVVPIYLELNEGEDKEGLKNIIGSNLVSMKSMLGSMENFRDSVEALPRMATSLNRSKRETKKVLQEVVDITQGGIASFEAIWSMLP